MSIWPYTNPILAKKSLIKSYIVILAPN